MTAQVFSTPPPDFSPQVEIAGCYVEFQDRILLLKRSSGKLEECRWGVPGGKLEPGEKPIEAVARELAEEAGITARVSQFQVVGSIYIRRPEVDFTFHLFYLHLTALPRLQIALEEHTEACWANLPEAKQLPLISGGSEVLDYFYMWKSSSINLTG